MNTENHVKILVADDHEIIRRGLRALIEAQTDWIVCGEAADGRTAVDLAEALSPDVVVMDLSMPELNGLEATRRILHKAHRPEVLVLTMHESEQHVREVLAAGARGYVLKTDAGRDLINAVEALLRGETYFTSQVAKRVHAKENLRGPRRASARPAGPLTPREREILQLLTEGKTNKEVGKALNISVKTAETHRARIMRKLSADSVAELVRYAIRNGMIAP